MRENTDQNNSEYGHFLRSDNDFICHQTCLHGIVHFFLGKKLKNIDWWSTNVTLVSITVKKMQKKMKFKQQKNEICDMKGP